MAAGNIEFLLCVASALMQCVLPRGMTIFCMPGGPPSVRTCLVAADEICLHAANWFVCLVYIRTVRPVRFGPTQASELRQKFEAPRKWRTGACQLQA